jgi:hypothetical protein
MKISVKVFFVILLFYYTVGTCIAQVITVNDKTQEVKLKKTEQASDTKDEKNKDDYNIKRGNIENKTGSVKQVKSARPDMSRSRGARPPDIVRPSGSRIPKGVGRPAGAGRHGHG